MIELNDVLGNTNQGSESVPNKDTIIIHREGNKAPQYIYTIAAAMCAFCAGTALSWTGPVLPMIEIGQNSSQRMSSESTSFSPPPLFITSEQGSWVASTITVGGLLGALPAGYFANFFGRKLFCILLSLPFLIGWIITVFARSAWHLYVARLIMGLASGASTVVVPVYIGEIAETSVRGSLGSFFQLMLTIGVLFVYTVGAFVSYNSLAVCCGITSIVFFVVFFSAPETPAYLLSKGHRSEAEASVRRLRGHHYDVDYEIRELEKELEKISENKEASISELFTRKSAQKGLVIFLGLLVFLQWSGVNVVIFYANKIFIEAGSTLNPSFLAIIIAVVQVVFAYVPSLLVDRAGRKILLLVSAAGMSLCQGLLGLYFYLKEHNHDVSQIMFLPVCSVSVFVMSFSIGFGTIPWVMAGELFAPNVKGPATGVSVGINWLMAFVVTKAYEPLKIVLGQGVMFGIFSSICLVGFLFVHFIVIETKAKSFAEIQKTLDRS